MPQSFIQIHIQFVFAVKYRQNLIPVERNDELQKYITGIVQNRKCKLLAINNMPDHLHKFVGLHPSYPPAKLVQEVKAMSSKFINEQNWIAQRFEWQGGYGAFSYARSQVKTVIRYILNQQKHHAKQNFKEEYIQILDNFELKYKNEDLFEFYE
jgi:REP element-mobilizing transposase RayT